MKLHNNLGQKLGKVASLSAVLLAFFGNAYAEEQVLDSTAAVVNNGIILESELNAHTQKLLSQYAATGAKVDEITARRQALQSLITRELILQIAQTNGAEVTDMQLDSTLESAALRNNTSTDKILKSYGPNLTEAQAREKFKEDYLINEIRRSSVRQRIHISPVEINTLAKALKQRGSVEPMYHIAQVVIPLSSAPNEAEYNRVQSEARQALNAIKMVLMWLKLLQNTLPQSKVLIWDIYQRQQFHYHSYLLS